MVRRAAATPLCSSDFCPEFGRQIGHVQLFALLVREVLLGIAPHISLFLIDVVLNQLFEDLGCGLVFG
jgi:hypothetical protein